MSAAEEKPADLSLLWGFVLFCLLRRERGEAERKSCEDFRRSEASCAVKMSRFHADDLQETSFNTSSSFN